jgi:endonuclease/exonuclease/phosphatase family metal-dependent hydrolase
MDGRDKTRLDSWCAGTGPLLFRPEAADGLHDSASSIDDLVLVSWNVHVGGADIDRFVTDLRSGRLSGGRHPRHIILLLQEVVRSGGVPSRVPAGASAARPIASEESIGRNDVAHLADRLEMSLFYAPSMRDGRSESRRHPAADRGNAILSTLPLADAVAIELPGERQRRVAVAARIPIDAGGERIRLSVSAAHLDTLGAPRTLWLLGAAAARGKQARSLAGALPDGPLILGADLNSWMGTGEPAVRTLLDGFPSTPSGAREATVRGGLVLDYMFFRLPSGWRAHFERASERYGSDHYPLIGSLSF